MISCVETPTRFANTAYDRAGRPREWLHLDTNESGDPVKIGFSYAYDRAGNKRWQRVLHNPRDTQRYGWRPSRCGRGCAAPCRRLRSTDSASRRGAYIQGDFSDVDWVERSGDVIRFGGLNRFHVPRLRRSGSALGQVGPSGRHLPFSGASRPALPEGVPRFPWDLDGLGNWTETQTKTDDATVTETREADTFNAYTKIGETDQTHDLNGNLTGDGEHTYAWEEHFGDVTRFGGLNRFHVPGNACCADSGTTIALYRYDAGNRRMLKDLYDGTLATPDPGVGGTSDTLYCYTGWQVAEERAASAGALGRQFVYGNYIDEPLAMDAYPGAQGYDAAQTIGAPRAGDNAASTDLENATRYTYHQNTLYSVYAITDADGMVVEAWSYDPYGKHTLHLDGPDADSEVSFTNDDLRTKQGNSAGGSPYGYTGRRFDSESNQWHYRERYYAADRARFLSMDPLGARAGAMGLYAYVGSLVTRRLDPSGLDSLVDGERTVYEEADEAAQGLVNGFGPATQPNANFRFVIGRRLRDQSWSPPQGFDAGRLKCPYQGKGCGVLGRAY